MPVAPHAAVIPGKYYYGGMSTDHIKLTVQQPPHHSECRSVLSTVLSQLFGVREVVSSPTVGQSVGLSHQNTNEDDDHLNGQNRDHELRLVYYFLFITLAYNSE